MEENNLDNPNKAKELIGNDAFSVGSGTVSWWSVIVFIVAILIFFVIFLISFALSSATAFVYYVAPLIVPALFLIIRASLLITKHFFAIDKSGFGRKIDRAFALLAFLLVIGTFFMDLTSAIISWSQLLTLYAVIKISIFIFFYVKNSSKDLEKIFITVAFIVLCILFFPLINPERMALCKPVPRGGGFTTLLFQYIVNRVEKEECAEDRRKIDICIDECKGSNDPEGCEACYGPSLKPVIYLYPKEKQGVKVELNYQGQLIADYPKYNEVINGWDVVAEPDGTLLNKTDNQEYSYLFWEGIPKEPVNWDLSRGFMIKGEDTREFLQTTLSKIGLTPKEYNEFIVYWYPKMKDNKYNLIHFAGDEYTKTAPLTITPKPDSILRVFMVFRPLKEKIDIQPQEFELFERKGFSVVEWGGTELK